MVRYTKNAGTRPYRRKLKFKNTKHLTSVLATLTPDQFEHLKKYARHYLGTHPIDGVPTHHKDKVLPSSYKTIVDTQYPKSLNALIVDEEQKHNDPHTESHMGGGLGTAMGALWSTARSFAEALPVVGKPLSWLDEKLSNPLHGREITKDDQENADVLIEAYQGADERAEKIHGWVRMPKYDTDYATVYYNPKTQDVHIGIAGSKSAHDWYHHNTRILTGQSAGKELVDSVREYLMKISEDFPKHNLEVTSHSLSGSVLKDVILGATPEETKLLDNIDELLFINPGSSPLADESSISEIMKDPRAHFYLNKSDLISQVFNQHLTKDMDFVYGEAVLNPLTAHQYRQFTSGNSEYDKPVDWGWKQWEAPEKPVGETAQMKVDTPQTQEAGLS